MEKLYKKTKQNNGKPDIETADTTPLLHPWAGTTPVITIYIGEDKETVHIPAHYLTAQSDWFSQAIKSNCTIFTFTREDPYSIKLLLEYLQTGTYTIPKHDYHPRHDSHNNRVGAEYIKLAERFPACRFGVHSRHAELYMLGERFEVSGLRDYALTALWNLLAAEDPIAVARNEGFEVFVQERLRLVRRVYRSPRSYTVELRRVLAFKFAENWSLYMAWMQRNRTCKGCLTFGDFVSGAPDFLHDVMVYLEDGRNTLAVVGKKAFLDSLRDN